MLNSASKRVAAAEGAYTDCLLGGHSHDSNIQIRLPSGKSVGSIVTLDDDGEGDVDDILAEAEQLYDKLDEVFAELAELFEAASRKVGEG